MMHFLTIIVKYIAAWAHHPCVYSCILCINHLFLCDCFAWSTNKCQNCCCSLCKNIAFSLTPHPDIRVGTKGTSISSDFSQYTYSLGSLYPLYVKISMKFTKPLVSKVNSRLLQPSCALVTLSWTFKFYISSLNSFSKGFSRRKHA